MFFEIQHSLRYNTLELYLQIIIISMGNKNNVLFPWDYNAGRPEEKLQSYKKQLFKLL